MQCTPWLVENFDPCSKCRDWVLISLRWVPGANTIAEANHWNDMHVWITVELTLDMYINVIQWFNHSLCLMSDWLTSKMLTVFSSILHINVMTQNFTSIIFPPSQRQIHSLDINDYLSKSHQRYQRALNLASPMPSLGCDIFMWFVYDPVHRPSSCTVWISLWRLHPSDHKPVSATGLSHQIWLTLLPCNLMVALLEKEKLFCLLLHWCALFVRWSPSQDQLFASYERIITLACSFHTSMIRLICICRKFQWLGFSSSASIQNDSTKVQPKKTCHQNLVTLCVGSS